ncbi:Rubber elongation factor [Macleaya cordata]|uniref:Rubber elongation factor n=1 Tax=Macleaya cordata TaxID=56857 RepID=A0A200Q1H6_MACCD|nr:Rubber elongation factor [Macleaya cordata]
MAEAEPKQQLEMSTQENEQRLRYLDFVQVAALQVIVCFTSLYDYAKENSGPLKPGVQTVEDTVKTVIGPVYEKFNDVPFELLKFVDRKVDDSVTELDRHVPQLVKEASTQAYTAAQKAPGVARAVASEVQRSGLVDTAKAIVKNVYTSYEPTAKDLYTKYEPVAEQYAVSAWRKLNSFPLFPQVAHVLVPTAAYWSEKYNQTVCYTAKRGYVISSYLPLVPLERIAKVFGNQGKAAHQNGSPVASSSSSASDESETETELPKSVK